MALNQCNYSIVVSVELDEGTKLYLDEQSWSGTADAGRQGAFSQLAFFNHVQPG